MQGIKTLLIVKGVHKVVKRMDALLGGNRFGQIRRMGIK
jgi:hypothetical protein